MTRVGMPTASARARPGAPARFETTTRSAQASWPAAMRSMIACRLVPVPEMSAPAATTRSLRSLSEQPRRLQRTIRGSAAGAALPNGCSLLPPAATNSRRASRAPHLVGRRCASRSRSPARSPRSPWLLGQTPSAGSAPRAMSGDVRLEPAPLAALPAIVARVRRFRADDAELLGEHEERREGRRAAERAEDADRPARAAGRHGGVERVGRTPHRLDHQVDRRIAGIPEEATEIALVDHPVCAERQRRRLLMRASRADDDFAGAAGARRDHRCEPDRPGAEYRDALDDLDHTDPPAVQR